MQPTRFQLSNSEATYPCCASCCSPLQPPDLSLSVSQSVGASASDGHIQMVQRYNQSRIAFPGLFSVKKKEKKNIYIYKIFPGPIHRLCGESTCIDGSSSLSDWAIWSPRFSHCGGHSSTFSLGSSTLACGICSIVGGLSLDTAQVRCSVFVH